MGWMDQGLNPEGGGQDFCLLPNVQISCGAHPDSDSYSAGTRGSHSGGEAAGM